MKVRLVVTVDVDPAKWQDEYKVRLSEVGDDVRRYFANHIHHTPAIQHADLEVTVR